MTDLQKCLVSFVFLCGSVAMPAMPAMAASSAASSASESVSTSVGSVSDSFKKSSESSTKKNDVAEGDYRVIEVADVAERPGMVRMRLQAVVATADADDGEFFLLLPRKAVAQGGVASGTVVTAQTRPYGTEFAVADTRQAFFLVLRDEWYRELPSNAVVL